MDAEKAVCVVVDESRKIVQGLTSETTTEDVLTALKGSCGKTSPQVHKVLLRTGIDNTVRTGYRVWAIPVPPYG